jgi:hypothetical protein
MDRPLITRQGVDAAYIIPDNVSRLGAAIECLNPPKGRCYCAYKVSGVLLAGASLSSRSSLCALLHFSFAIYSSPRMGRRPDLNGFHILSTDHPQLSPRFHHRIGLSVLETFNFLRYLAARLYHSLQSVRDGPTSVDK